MISPVSIYTALTMTLNGADGTVSNFIAIGRQTIADTDYPNKMQLCKSK